MAGAGYTLFNTGDVLTAGQVNNYLQEQTVMRFANATARTTALSGVLAEGMVSYLDDTNQVEVYNGSSWGAVSASIPTSYELTAGKNKILNGDFGISQRGTTFTAAGIYGFDRWVLSGTTGQMTISQLTTSLPAQFQYGVRIQRTSGTSSATQYTIAQPFETAASIPLQGRTVILSFYAKAGANFSGASGQGLIRMYSGTGTNQSGTSFGGWSGYSEWQSSGVFTPTTSWARYTVTGTVPSNATQIGIRIGWTTTGTAGADDSLDITGVQLEAGNTATAFQTATGTLAGELQAAQRYYTRWQLPVANYSDLFLGQTYTSTQAAFPCQIPVQMRTTPTGATSGLAVVVNNLGSRFSGGTIAISASSPRNFVVTYTHGSAVFTAGQVAWLQINNSASDFLELSAEL